MTWTVLTGDAGQQLAELPERSVQTCITSPPYFGLRDYGTGQWKGGDEGCDHVQRMARGDGGRPATEVPRGAGGAMVASGSSVPTETPIGFRDICGKCGATRTDSQIGLEPTPDEYVNRLVEVFREVRRVLRDDGTVWLNLGDSYASDTKGSGGDGSTSTLGITGNAQTPEATKRSGDRQRMASRKFNHGCKAKDLLGIPWMVAFALRADGWYLRSDIIWAKPNPMPESVTDRPTKAHEYLFLLSKSKSYFYDADAVREELAPITGSGGWQSMRRRQEQFDSRYARDKHADERNDKDSLSAHERDYSGRNKRSVWTVATAPFPGAHFAVFPPKLIEPCVLAGSSDKACGVCGAPWKRVVERTPMVVRPAPKREAWQASGDDHARTQLGGTVAQEASSKTVGFAPSCDHQDDKGSSTVLDPFCGAGTTGLVATRHGRNFIGIELNPAYARMARRRIADDAPLFHQDHYDDTHQEGTPT